MLETVKKCKCLPLILTDSGGYNQVVTGRHANKAVVSLIAKAKNPQDALPHQRHDVVTCKASLWPVCALNVDPND